MKARTIGPILMMTLGAALILMPANGWVGAGNQAPCDTVTIGVAVPCDSTTIAATTTLATTTTIEATTTIVATTTVTPSTTTDIGSGGRGLPTTGSTSPSYVVLGGLLLISGAGLLVLGRNRTDPGAT